MRITKYFVLLLMLFAFALMVFVFTQEGIYNLNKTIIVKNLDKDKVYNYIIKLDNWKGFIFDSENQQVIKDKEFLWANQKYQLSQKFPSDSILISHINDDNQANLKINLEKINNSTRITWNIKGKYTYKEKFLALFYGNNNKNLSLKIEKYLNLINQNLQKEYFYYQIKYDKIITLPEQIFYYKTVNCSISNQNITIKNNLLALNKTLDSLNIKYQKKPILIYNYFDSEKNNTQFQICQEIPKFSDTLFSKKDIFIKKSMSYQKVNYNGNQKYLPNFWSNITIELQKRNLIYLRNQSTLELVNEKNFRLLKNYDYQTVFLIPIFQKQVLVNANIPINKVIKPKIVTREVIQTIEKPEIKEVETEETLPVEN